MQVHNYLNKIPIKGNVNNYNNNEGDRNNCKSAHQKCQSPKIENHKIKMGLKQFLLYFWEHLTLYNGADA